jgi:predicted nucleic acid-binding protein
MNLRKISLMLAVSNTSPISNLAYIGRLDLLEMQFGEICVPRAVELELAKHPDPKAYCRRLWAF